jgi:cell wall-associated protease
MKMIKSSTLYFMVINFFIVLIGNSQDFYGVYQGREIPYFQSDKKVLVKFKTSKITTIELNSILSDMSDLYSLDMAESKYAILNADTFVKDLIDKLNAKEDVECATPILENAQGAVLGGITNIFVVGLKSPTDYETLRTFCYKFNNIKSIRQSEFDKKVFFLSIDKESNLNSLEMSYKFSKSGLFRYAEPEYLIFDAWGTDDPAFDSQYALTQANGMNVIGAWQLTTGCSSVRVAVLDNGVQLNHPDLVANMLSGFDATGGGSNGGPTGNANHGTACAGIVAAEANNGIGVAGVAYNSRIVPVRVGTGSLFSFTDMAAGIHWVINNNAADIITLSAGSIGVFDQTVTDAINSATTNGRNNLGIPFISITQNDSDDVIAFPASLPNVIAVGSVNNNGNRASTSNYGTGIDVVAPGVCIYTTDLTGGAGQTNWDYWTCFSGTSAAAPQVAGVAALVLSINASLTSQQVRNIIESTADKVGGVTYTFGAGEQVGLTWNNQMGYGRVNALRAVQAAVNTYIITGPSFVCTTNTTLTLSNPPVGATVSWAVTPTNLFGTTSGASVSGSGTTATLRALNNWSSGEATITFTITSGCGSVNVQKTFWVGGPAAQGIDISNVYDPLTLCPHTQYIVEAYGFAGGWPITEYEWLIPSGWTSVQGGSQNPFIHNDALVQLTTTASGPGFIRVMAKNEACGYGPPYFLWIDTECSWGRIAMSVYPNPAIDQLHITFGDSTKNEIATLLIYDDQNVKRHEQEISNHKTVSVANLSEGVYYIHIQNKDGIHRKRLVIKRPK